MSRNYFGTDGVRGTVGASPMTADFVLRLGYAAGKVLSGQGEHPTVLIGKDTRISGYMLEAALEAGFTSAGVNVLLTGPLPTPGVAYLTRAPHRRCRRALHRILQEHVSLRAGPAQAEAGGGLRAWCRVPHRSARLP